MARQSSVREIVKNLEDSDKSDLPMKSMSPGGWNAMLQDKKKKNIALNISDNESEKKTTEGLSKQDLNTAQTPSRWNVMFNKKKNDTAITIPEKNEGDKKATKILAKQALDTAQAPLMEDSHVETPPITEQLSCWRSRGCKMGLGGTLALIGTLFAVLAYLNDICVFPKCEDTKGTKPCWDNDVEYVDSLGIGYNILDGHQNKKDSIIECESSCQRYSDQGCLFWSYHKTFQWCSLKRERVDSPRAANHYISGSLGCKVPSNFLDISHAYNKNISLKN